MFLRVQRGSTVPVSRQIDAQLRAQILSGVLASAEQLPSVRQLARELGVNVNTVFRVYERLSADGLIDLRHGDGTYVAPGRKIPTAARLAERRRELASELDALVRRGLMLGLAADQLQQMLADSLERVQADVASEIPSPKHEASP